jgi:hypothetical protein
MSGRPACPFETEVLLLGDGPLPARRRFLVEAHLALCPSCARIEETLEAVRETLRLGGETPLGVVAPALAALAPRPRRQAIPLAAAGLALACAGWLLARPGPEPSGAPPSPEARPPVARAPSAPPSPAPAPPEPRREIPSLPPPARRAGPALGTLLAALDPGAADHAERVAEAAARIHAEGAGGIAALAALLGSEDPGLLARAVEVAARIPSLTLVDPLVRLVGRGEFAGRAARALGAAGSPRAIPALAAALDGPAAAEAREALVSIGGRDAARVFQDRLSSLDAEAEAEALELLDALARIDPAVAARRCAAEPGGAPERKVLGRHRERLLPELRRIAAAGDDLSASGAALALGSLRDGESLEALARLALRPATASAACSGLLGLGSDRAVEAAFRAACRCAGAVPAFDGAAHAERFLVARLDRGTFAERRVALRLLARCGGPAAVGRIAAGGLDRSLLPDAVATLGAIGGEEGIRALGRFLPERALRGDVIRALGETRDPLVLPLLRSFAGQEGCARQLCLALSRIPHEESAAMLVDLALSGAATSEAARALAELRAPLVVPLLLERLEEGAGRGRARELLVRIAGTDLGPGRDRWKNWWESRP